MKLNFLLHYDTCHWITPPPPSQGGHQNMMWAPIKWFVHQGSWRPLPALYKNSPPDPGAGYSWDGGHSQFSFCLCCLLAHSWLRTPVSHMTHSGPCLEGMHTGFQRSKVGDKSACVCLHRGPRRCNHLGACMPTPNWQHFEMVLFHLTSALRRCSSSLKAGFSLNSLTVQLNYFTFMWFVLLVSVEHRVLPNKQPFVCHHKRLLQTGLYASVPKAEDFCHLINEAMSACDPSSEVFCNFFYDRRAVEPLVPHAYVPAKAMAGDTDVKTLRGKMREANWEQSEEKWHHPH